jgi:nucleoside phosphorylase
MTNNGIHAGRDMIGNSNIVTNPPPAPAPGDRRQQRRAAVDVLVITALKSEFDAVKAVAGVSHWQNHDDPAPYSTIECRTEGGRTISVALARPTHMGGRTTGPIATLLTEELRPACLAMCGVCAGNPTATTPGDVIVASPAYEWDEGKHTGGVFRADPQQFPQDNRWIRVAQEFDPSGLPSYGTATDAEATAWYLERLYKEQDPRTHPARERYFPPSTWGARLERLESDGLITWQDAGWVLTEVGRHRIQRTLYIDVDAPRQLPFAVFVGPMASGSAVMSEPDIWDRLGVGQRNLLALEMEAATIATIAHQLQVPHWLVAKGVMDHADLEKDDRFKAFAAKASAEVLFALLAKLLSPAAASPRPAPRAKEIPAAVKLEVVRRLTYDWQDLADIVGVPPYEMRRFRAGDEPRELWAWLQQRGRLADLPGALDDIGRADLAALLRPYL